VKAWIPLASAVAFVAVAVGMSVGFWSGLALMSVGMLAAVAATAMGHRGGDPARSPARGSTSSPRAEDSPFALSLSKGERWLLAVVLLAFCVWHLFLPPGIYVQPAQPPEFRVLAAVATAIALTYVLPLGGGGQAPALQRVLRWRFPALVLVFAAMGLVVIHASPKPHIDVWWYQQWAGELVWDGYNPYTFDYPNIHRDDRLFGPGVLRGGRISAYPYPPLTFLLGAPVVKALHDVRFLLLALMVAAAVFARRWAREDAADLAIAALLLQPNSFYVLELAWTEPFVAAAFAVAVTAVLAVPGRARGWIGAGVAGGLLVATKQYVLPLALPLVLALPRGVRLRSLALATAVAAATILPFVVADPGEFWHDIVVVQTLQPFRFDSLSWLVPVARTLGRPVSAGWGFVAAGIVLAGWLRPGIGVAQAARISAATMLGLVLFNKQAFANYYWLCTALLAFAYVLSLREPVGDGAGTST
jgi:hypothetical protein